MQFGKLSLNQGNSSSLTYDTDMSPVQAVLLMVNLEGVMSRLRKYSPVEIIIDAIAYVVKTGCRLRVFHARIFHMKYPKFPRKYTAPDLTFLVRWDPRWLPQANVLKIPIQIWSVEKNSVILSLW